MVKVEVVKDFTLKDFDKIKNLKRGTVQNQIGHLYEKDTFECSNEMVDYLTGNNPINVSVVRVLEVVPEKIEVVTEPITEIKKEIFKKSTKKKKSAK